MGLNKTTRIFNSSSGDTESAAQAQAILPLHEARRLTTDEVEPFAEALPELEVANTVLCHMAFPLLTNNS